MLLIYCVPDGYRLAFSKFVFLDNDRAMITLLFLKAIVSIAIVVGLSIAAERSGPRLAGLLIGLPLGAGMVVIFTGYEQGAEFAAASAVHMVPGFLTTFVFIYCYGAIAARQNKGGLSGIVMPTLGAHVAYGAAAWGLSQFQIPLVISVPMLCVGVVIVHRMMASLPDNPITARVTFGWKVLAFRAGMATTVIVIITSIAGQVGPQWTGILTAYPITLFPLILVLHITYAGAEVAAVLKHVPFAMGSVTSFCLAIVFAVPEFGLWWGILLGYGAAATYLMTFSAMTRAFRKA